jgi:plastocyanin
MKNINFRLFCVVPLLIIVLVVLAACSSNTATNTTSTTKTSSTTSTQATTTTVATSSTTPTVTSTTAGQAVAISLVAKNMAFDKKTITVAAGASVTMNFENQDSAPHNFALYTNSGASQSIFVGQVIAGPKTITYTFTAPSVPGTYFFRCDVHPTAMTGSFVVN